MIIFTASIQTLADQAQAIYRLVENVSLEQARWRPASESWSLLEVINHLYDEEREDFREHLDFILHRSEGAWHRIDPQGWVTARSYNERDIDTSLENFLAEREKSLTWLRSLHDPDWQVVAQAPWGPINAGDMFAAWLAHDLLHLRQIVELLYAWHAQEAGPYGVGYAGDW
jgi:hypothetical protein